MSQQDHNFDAMAERFSKNIYAGKKGAIRLHVIDKDLQDYAPEIYRDNPLSILDAGGGTGVTSLPLAKLGHSVVLCDISHEMIRRAETAVMSEGLEDRMRCIHTSVQSYAESTAETYDVVLFHAVLEWVNKPQETLAQVLPLVKSGGCLSLMFYNVHSIIHRNLIRGNLRKVKTGKFGGDGKGLTPINPLYPQQVIQWLTDAGWTIELQSGVRVFFDNLTREKQQLISLDDILEMECRYSREEPYRLMGRYCHFVCRKH